MPFKAFQEFPKNGPGIAGKARELGNPLNGSEGVYIKSEYHGPNDDGTGAGTVGFGSAEPLASTYTPHNYMNFGVGSLGNSNGNDNGFGSAAISDADLIGSLGGEADNPDFSMYAPPAAAGSFLAKGRHLQSETPPVPEDSSPFDAFMMRRTYDTPSSYYNSPADWNIEEAVGSASHSKSKQRPSFQSSMAMPVGSNTSAGWDTQSRSSFADSNMSSPRAQRLNSIEEIPTVSATANSSSGDRSTAAIMEKRRKRRESHNAVERRRRDNINEKIQELASLLPDMPLSTSPIPESPPSKDCRPNKGVVLHKSVDYIRHLQQLILEQQRRQARLEDMVRTLGGDLNLGSMDTS